MVWVCIGFDFDEEEMGTFEESMGDGIIYYDQKKEIHLSVA